MTTENLPTVLIVDDHATFRPFVHTLLAAGGWNVVGEAADAAEAIAEARRLRPDFVLLDVQLPDRSGFEVADELARSEPAPGVVLMSSREAADYGSRVRSAPAHGFLNKGDLSGAALAELVQAARR